MIRKTPVRNPKRDIRTKVFCILSDERAFLSKSPAIFNSVIRQTDIDGVYVPLMVEPGHIGEAVRSLRVLNIAGANITLPYKESVIPFIDVLSEGANIIGAINTIARDGEVLKGYNTNAIGFMDSLESIGMDASGMNVLVFGNGGAARAVVFMLNWLHAKKVFIAARNMEKTELMIDRIGGEPIPFDDLGTVLPSVDIVVNATSVSSPSESEEMAAFAERLRLPKCRIVIDLNYGRPRNFWAETAEANGVRFMDGLPVLAHQARRSFALWTGMDVDVKEFLNPLLEG